MTIANPTHSDPCVAVIGGGYWGKNLVRNFAELGALHTICDSSQETLSQMAKAYPGVHLENDLAPVLADPAIAGVVISSPAALHYTMARQALEAGKDVFVEKPLALAVKEGKELVRLAERKGRILMVGHLLQYHPAVMKLKELADAGELGKLNYIYSSRLNLGRFRTEENILWSFAPHDIAVILLLLGEMPGEVSAHGGSYLNQGIADVTVTTMDFKSGAKAHLFVSWLHPYKEQRLVVIGDRRMAVFDDVAARDKLLLYEHQVEWVGRRPTPRRAEARAVAIEADEPLKLECQHFLDCIKQRLPPRTDGANGLRVLRVLEAAQTSLNHGGGVVSLAHSDYFVHPSSIVEEPASIGEGTRIWHFSHVMPGASIGKNTNIGQNVFIAGEVAIGNNVKIQNNVSIFEGVTLEDDVFCGPSCVFTNVNAPRSHISQKGHYSPTLVKQGATIGANATIVCGHTIGEYAFIGAGSVVTGDIPAYALVYGNPARVKGWVCQCGAKLDFTGGKDKTECPKCHQKYLRRGRGDSVRVEKATA